jgi:ribosome-binding protein aMBF1 (putative translation factor)
MADDKRKPGRPDRNRINVNEDYELRDWSQKLGVSKEELAAAVKRVGPMVRDVEVELKRAP